MLGNLLKIILFIGLVANFAGCAVMQKDAGSQEPPGEVSKEVGAYFYYTQSYLMKKQGDLSSAIELLGEAIARDRDSIYLKTELARLYVQHSDYKQAIEIVREIVKKRPEHVPSMTMLGDIYAAQGKHAKAVESYQKVLALESKSERLYLLLGSEYVKSKNPEKALDTYKNLTEINPESFPGYFYLGVVAVSLKQYELAEGAFLECLKLKPGYEQVLFKLLEVYEALEKDKKVLDTYNKILDNNPRSIKAAIGLGHYYLKTGETADAEKVFEKLKKRSRSNPLVIKQIALIYLDQKRYKEAVEALRQLLEDDSSKSDIYYFLGMALEGIKQIDEAISAYENVGGMSSYHQSALVHLSFLYQEKGDSNKAIELMNQAIEKQPQDPGSYLFLGALYEEMGSYEEAIDTLKTGLQFQSDHVRLHFRLGVIYDKAGYKNASISEMKQVIEIDPSHAEALNYLGYTYADLGKNLDEAEILIKKAMKYKPNDGYIMDSLGWVYYKQGLFDKALEFLEEAGKLVSDDPTILEHLGDAYQKINAHRKALKYYNKALENKKSDKEPLERKIELIEKQLDQDI